MSESLENLKAALKDLPQENLQALLAEVTASGQGAVAIARDATGAKIVTGSDNILGDHNRVVIHQGMDAETLKLVLQELLASQRVYFYGLPETQPQIQAIAQAIREEINKLVPSQATEVASVDKLVQQVRSRLHDDIQRLHGTMPLWGVDHWMPLGELFVDVNILEEVSSNRRTELADLWQDFSQNPGYRSLDRMGLGEERQRVSGLEVLARNTNLMVVGKPGSGKTTYLQRMVTECNAENLQANKIPVLIKLREFIEDGRDIAYSLEQYLERSWQLSTIETQLVLNQGRSLMLLDGLDEVTGEGEKTIAKQIKRFARIYPQVQVIVTCRMQSQESRFERFDYVEVADFNELQVRAFAEHWFQTVCGDLTTGQAKATAFLEQLFRGENKSIRNLAITPILLSLTCAVFQQKQAFYSKRSKLYGEGLELLLERWDKSREIERDEIYRDLSVERKLDLLSHLAVKKFEQEQYVLFEQAEIEGYIAEFLGIGLQESQEVLKAIAQQHGLLVERAHKIWTFSHLTFQEYFVAKWFWGRSGFDKLASHIWDTHWREIFLLTAEAIREPCELFLLMKGQIDHFLIGDEQLQEFLDWVHNQSSSTNSSYSISEIRAFYFNFQQAHFGMLNLDYFQVHLKLLGIDNNLKQATEGITQLNLNLIYGYRLEENYIKRIQHLLDLSLYRDYALASLIYCSQAYIDKNVNNIKIFEHPLRLEALDRGFFMYLNRLLEIEGKSVFGVKLKQLAMHLPQVEASQENWKWYVKDTEAYRYWWENHSQDWISELKEASVKYRNIGRNWKFSDLQNQALKKYFDASKLLVDCIQISQSLSNSSYGIVEDIQENLFLPIDEIEKRKKQSSN
ncbi:NACHT domain-containing protein [Leptolyngbya sp. CCNP1308]|uniref:NACHT domain-containing protein n=1 Tax=Leptolyngbya sp. CCNP1308 TaxID=3110255 RepID=UPI002B1F0BA8|nr:NACHT domain-containing protein [Leptolyngbya sp. CCNP1308]MEA5447550.1 NACHT domain-containing protein [Leptolyngbya sp. CCNP1308]